MAYGITEDGFVIKRLDTILEEIHTDLSDGFGVNTRTSESTFLNVLVTTFANQIAELWETAQDSYYAKYPATATGINLDNAIQYAGIKRGKNEKTCYPLHCKGNDGTVLKKGTVVATNTLPSVRLSVETEAEITRSSFNIAEVKIASAGKESYSVSLNGNVYSYSSTDGIDENILNGLAAAITDDKFDVSVTDNVILISDKVKSRSNVLILSDNLTTRSVTSICDFMTENYGKITLSAGVITKIITDVSGFDSVTNIVTPAYGRLRESDIELRQSYIAKSALRSNTMIDSIVAEILNNVPGVESASGYENDTDAVNERGMPPHSIEIIVEGGDETDIASAILKRKAGGIYTFGSNVINVPGGYGESIPVRFNRPEYVYAWLKIVLHGDSAVIPDNYLKLVQSAVMTDGNMLTSGDNMLLQLFTERIYDDVAGVTYIDIYTASSTSKSYAPEAADYAQKNIIVTSRQKILFDRSRIEVTYSADS